MVTAAPFDATLFNTPPPDPLPRAPTVAGRIMVPQRCSRLNPPDHILYYLTRQKGLADVIKLRILS